MKALRMRASCLLRYVKNANHSGHYSVLTSLQEKKNWQ